jgi:predicted RNA binding protein YcfA (HicA-like mRNA interferase family)
MPLSGKEIIKLLKKDGWKLIRVKGSHHILGKGELTVSVPVHSNKSIGRGLEQKLIKITGIRK